MDQRTLLSRSCSILRPLLVLVVLASGARADTITLFNNLRPAFSNLGDVLTSTSPVWSYVAVRFSPGATARLTSVTLDLYNANYYTVPVEVYLLTDANSDNRPDTLHATLPSITLPALVSGTYIWGPFTSTVTSPVFLEKDKNYWLAVHAVSRGYSAYWNTDGASQLSRTRSSNLTTGYSTPATGRYSFAVYGDPVPEPATAALAGLGLGFGVLFRLRRRKQA
jgi:hypothetical protein